MTRDRKTDRQKTTVCEPNKPIAYNVWTVQCRRTAA